MKSKLAIRKRTNLAITKKIIELHEQGYHLDFQYQDCRKIICLQDDLRFEVHDLSIKLVDQLFDQFSKTFKYIHSVESTSGYKGVLLCDTVFITPYWWLDPFSIQKILFPKTHS